LVLHDVQQTAALARLAWDNSVLACAHRLVALVEAWDVADEGASR